jgi:hypothetical protein
MESNPSTSQQTPSLETSQDVQFLESPIYELLEKPLDQCSDEELEAMVRETRTARVNSHVLVQRISGEVKKKRVSREKSSSPSPSRQLDLTDLLG